MIVRNAMSQTVLTIGPTHTLRQAAKMMAERKVGAAVVLDPDGEGPGILGRAAAAMVKGGFRHLVVCDEREVVGIISVRDIVRAQTAVTA